MLQASGGGGGVTKFPADNVILPKTRQQVVRCRHCGVDNLSVTRVFPQGRGEYNTPSKTSDGTCLILGAHSRRNNRFDWLCGSLMCVSSLNH